MSERKSSPVSYRFSVSAGTGCYRHIQLDGDCTLLDLHAFILEVFEFVDDHAHAFFMNNRGWTREEAYYADFIEDAERYTSKVRLCELDLFEGKKFLYIFDFGEEWRFQCRVLKVLQEKTPEPLLLREVGEPPEQYGYWDDEEE